jgi:hypothetical protein
MTTVICRFIFCVCSSNVNTCALIYTIPLFPFIVRFSRFTFEDLSRNGTGIQNNSNLFMCDNGEYIRQEFKCDMEKNCLDGSDEVACGKGSTKCFNKFNKCTLKWV